MTRHSKFLFFIFASIGNLHFAIAQNSVLKKGRSAQIKKVAETEMSVQFLVEVSPPQTITNLVWTISPSVSNKIQKANSLLLERLKPGRYKLKAYVTNSQNFSYYSPEFVYLKKPNIPPAIKSNDTPQSRLPVVVIDGQHTLNAGESVSLKARITNNVSVAEYKWEQSKGSYIKRETSLNQQELILRNLQAGAYEFKLTVKDLGGKLTQSLFTVTVAESTLTKKNGATVIDHSHTDTVQHPPSVKIINGSQTIQLPINSVTIDCNASDLDGRIVSYQWVKVIGPSAIINGDNHSSLKVSNMEPGRYTFRVLVTDDRGNTGFAIAEVLVMPSTVLTPIVYQKPASHLSGGPSNALLNLVLPGLGHYEVSGDYSGKHKKGAVFLISLAYLGSAGGAAYFKWQSNNDYQVYLKAANYRESQVDASGTVSGVRGGIEADAKKYFDRAQAANRNFITLASVAGGILATDFIYTLFRGSKNKRGYYKHYHLNKKVFYNPASKQSGVGLALNF